MDLFEGPKVNTKASDKALKGLDEAKKAAAKLKPVGINAGGLKTSLKNNSISVTSNANRTGLVQSIADQFLEQAGLTKGLRDKVAPGVSDLRASRLREIENARRASISDLRDNLARRRVLGSSFGADAETRANLEFAQQSEKVAAESFLQELDLTNKLIGQEFDLKRQAFGTKVAELNIQADLAAGLTSQATALLSQSAQIQAQLASSKASITANQGIAQAEMDAKAQAGAGALIGKIAGLALAPMTGGLSLAALGAGGMMAPTTETFAV
jgi:hypothetical protein